MFLHGQLGLTVESEGIVEEEGAPLLLRGRHRQDPVRIVVIPVRIIGREEQPVPADPPDRVEHVRAEPRFFHRLGGEEGMARLRVANHISAEHELHAVEAIADRKARGEPIKRIGM